MSDVLDIGLGFVGWLIMVIIVIAINLGLLAAAIWIVLRLLEMFDVIMVVL